MNMPSDDQQLKNDLSIEQSFVIQQLSVTGRWQDKDILNNQDMVVPRMKVLQLEHPKAQYRGIVRSKSIQLAEVVIA